MRHVGLIHKTWDLFQVFVSAKLELERSGLVGANGTGKSTLLKILCGMESLDYGSINFPKGIRLGYLPQDGLMLTGRTVFAECMTVFAGLREMEQELEALHQSLGELDPASP